MQVNPETRMGIVGTGVMGAYHTRVAAVLPGCQLAGIYDADNACAARVAQQYGVTAYRSLPELCEAVDAVIVATPTFTHARIATECLQAGVHVLLEKPIAATLAEAEALVALSAQAPGLLMIGHVERFNPAVSALQTLLDPSELFACELQRLSVAPGRDQSVDIIFDLMIHDFDLALALVGAPVSAHSAVGHCITGKNIDHASALLRFANGATAALTASAVSHERMRTGRFYTRNAVYTVDFANRQLWVHQHGKSSYARGNSEPYQAHHVEQLFIANIEPLVAEQEHFLEAIRHGTPPVTDAYAGLHALQLAYAVQTDVNNHLLAPV